MTYNITTLGEDALNNGNCTLREALLAAADDTTHDLCVGDSSPDEIVLQVEDPNNPYSLQDGPIELSGRDLVVRGELAHRPYYYLVDMGSSQRFLSTTSGSRLSLETLTLQNGLVAGHGGAVLASNSDLTMRDVVLYQNAATSGGAIAFEATTPYTLDMEQVDASLNGADDQGGAIFVNLLGGGHVRFVDAYLANNTVVAPLVAARSVPVVRRGGALDLYAQGVVSMELRHLEFVTNQIHAQTDAFGGAAAMFVTGSGAIVAEDIDLNDNFVTPDGNPSSGLDATGLSLSVFGPSLHFRRLHSIANAFGGGEVDAMQVKIEVGTGTDAILSDFLVASGNRSGLSLAANGGPCSMVAGNLTVTGFSFTGLSLAQSGSCTLRLENSIVWDNDFSGQNPYENLVLIGAPDVDAVANRNLIDNLVDPLFLGEFANDYRVGGGSPAFDAGDQTFLTVGPYDVGHGARVLGADIEIGAYESGALLVDDFEYGDAYAWSKTVP